MTMLESIQLSAGPSRPRCVVGKFKFDNPDKAEELDEALFTKDDNGEYLVSGVQIANYLNNLYTLNIRPSSIRAHRRTDCACR